MGKLVSAATERDILSTIDAVRNLGRPTTTPRRRIIHAGGGGAQRPYITIKTVTNKDEYVGNVITPTDATVLIADVTVNTSFSSEGLLKVGDKMFSDKIGSIYYISPATFLGA